MEGKNFPQHICIIKEYYCHCFGQMSVSETDTTNKRRRDVVDAVGGGLAKVCFKCGAGEQGGINKKQGRCDVHD